ncbi:hypothetical protein CR194_17325 [Salipaludibacillus keqinensis]|uniref:Sortilin N-terminal domain-containing protein n=1 Tax=Salipaludibacillus keqinensis TaxID=2045207 RepID=A0A323TAA6_9BACI|nr:hypothetical protein [Salipaludibacillus keqinensis]PYZ91960.1 hypothetical protein CR194_17325 [Salipaludibacillus keqinensis]
MKRVIPILIISLMSISCSSENSDETQVEEIEHVHDLAFDREGKGLLYAGTHHGLLQIDKDGENMTWRGDESERHDFMGFTITSDNIFVSSGHPDHDSDLQDPLGVMISEDQGQSWSRDILYGEVDFHLIDVNESNPSVIYGFDAYGQRVKRSSNAGQEWETASMAGTNPEGELYAIISDSLNADVVLTGTADGIYMSEDRGETFERINSELTMTSVDHGSEGQLLAHGVGQIEGLMISDDLGETWEPIGELPTETPVLSLAVDPLDEKTIAIGTADDSIYLSKDEGNSWEVIVDQGEPVFN